MGKGRRRPGPGGTCLGLGSRHSGTTDHSLQAKTPTSSLTRGRGTHQEGQGREGARTGSVRGRLGRGWCWFLDGPQWLRPPAP